MKFDNNEDQPYHTAYSEYFWINTFRPEVHERGVIEENALIDTVITFCSDCKKTERIPLQAFQEKSHTHKCSLDTE